MKMIIVGCGRVGTALARILSLRKHDITVIDKDPAAFEALGPAYKGQKIVGIGFDQDVLRQASIDRTDALAAVTASDETNLVIARLAKQVYRVPRVAVRVYEPRKAEIYRRFGFQTISPVVLGTLRLAELLTFSHLSPVANIGSGEVEILDVEVPAMLVGRTTQSLTINGEAHIVAITRMGKTFLPSPSTTFQEGDLVHMAVVAASSDRLRAMLS